MDKLTIVTPIYNRAHCIRKLYDSLCRQTALNFDWMIIDDGSTDNIEKVVKSFDNKFNVIYEKKENGGKCSALNCAIAQCNTELFFVVDSDDYLVDDAVQKIYDMWKQIDFDNTIIGIVGNRVYEDGTLSGKEFPCGLKNITMNELNYQYHHHGETALIFRTSILKQHMFPIYAGENFLSEEIQYNELDNYGQLAILKEPLIVMKYLEDGLTRNYFNNWLRNPNGTKAMLQSRYNHIAGLSFVNIVIKRFKTILIYDVLCLKSQLFSMKESPCSMLGWICLPIAWFIQRIRYK